MSSPVKTIRLDGDLLERLAAIAKQEGIPFSAAMRRAIRKGVIAIEAELKPSAPAVQVRRRVLSRGVE